MSVASAAEGLEMLRTGAVTGSVPDRALIEVRGRDAADYLHRRLSQAVKTLAPGRGAHALLLEGDGRLSLELLVYRTGHGFLLLVPSTERERAADLIEKYIIMDDVSVVRAWQDFEVINLSGARAAEAVAAVSMDAVQESAGDDVCTTPWKIVTPFQCAGTAGHLMRDGRWMTPHYLVAVPIDDAPRVRAAAVAACRGLGGDMIGTAAWEAHRFIEGVPTWGAELREGLVPLEAGLRGAVSFTKGCFPGQEVLARISNLGHPARLLAWLDMEGEHEVRVDTPLQDGNGMRIGGVAASMTAPGLGRTLASAFIAWESRGLDHCTIGGGSEGIPARITSVVDRGVYDANKKPVF